MRRRLRLRRLRFGLVACAVVVSTLASSGTSLALFSASRSAGGNTFTTAVWAPSYLFYLHNNPTPPTSDTKRQVNLAMNGSAPGATTLYNYSTNCAANPGRLVQAVAPNPNQNNACRYVNWLAPAAGSPSIIAGTWIVDVWSATDTAAADQTGGLVAYLRDYNLAAHSYTEIASSTLGGTYALGRTFYHRPISVTVGSTYTLAAGHQLEVELIATNQYTSNMLVAYDTTTYPAALRFP